MIDLLKCDLMRAIKDKLFVVLCIVGSVFAVATPLLYKLIFAFMAAGDTAELEMLGLQMTSKTLFFSSFSAGNNFGLILPILVAIIICKDFSHGTIRNKIISGKSRTAIYFSTFTTCAILLCGLIMAHAVLTLLVSLIFFDYQESPFTAGDFGYLMASLGFEILVYLFICAILTFFIVFMKNAGLAIVMYFVVNFVMLITGSIIQTAVFFADITDSAALELFEFISDANVFSGTLIGNGSAYEPMEVLALLLPNIVLTAIFVLLGLVTFKRKDLK